MLKLNKDSFICIGIEERLAIDILWKGTITDFIVMITDLLLNRCRGVNAGLMLNYTKSNELKAGEVGLLCLL